MPTRPSRQAFAERHQPGEAGGARALDEVVRRPQEQAQRLGDLGVGDGDEVRQPLAERAERRGVDAPRREAVGERVRRGRS